MSNPDAGNDEAETPVVTQEGTDNDEAYGCPVTEVRGQQVLHPDRHGWRNIALQLLDDGWNMCLDVTAVDYSAHHGNRNLADGVEPERFEVVASFLSYERHRRLRARIQVPGEDPTVDSLYAVYPGTDFLEREVYDLFGIIFSGHPDLSRILMPESWDGHPLRKDFAISSIPVQFKAPSRR